MIALMFVVFAIGFCLYWHSLLGESERKNDALKQELMLQIQEKSDAEFKQYLKDNGYDKVD